MKLAPYNKDDHFILVYLMLKNAREPFVAHLIADAVGHVCLDGDKQVIGSSLLLKDYSTGIVKLVANHNTSKKTQAAAQQMLLRRTIKQAKSLQYKQLRLLAIDKSTIKVAEGLGFQAVHHYNYVLNLKEHTDG